MSEFISEPPSRSTLKTVATVLACLVAGLAVGWATGKLIGTAELRRLPWSDMTALILAMPFLAGGLLMAGLSVDRRGRAILANPRAPDFARPVGPAQSTFFRLQAAVLVLTGGLLATPVAFEVAAAGRATLSGPLTMAGVVAGFALQTGLNLALWARSDEVYRRTFAETGAVCFWLLQGALFLWASGEKLQVLRPISAWDAFTVLMGVYLVTSTIVAWRRGIE